jgi:hypothetical protein
MRAGGAKIIDRQSADLRSEFLTIRGFSSRNLKYKRAFAKAWPEKQIVQQASAQLIPIQASPVHQAQAQARGRL